MGRMKAIRVCLIVSCLSLLMISCSGSEDLANSGYVTMMPYVNEGMGIRVVVPLNWTEVSEGEFVRRISQRDQTTLVLAKLPNMSLDEAKSFAASELGLEQLPPSAGTYSSSGFTWDLYEFESMMSGVMDMKLHLALASNEGGAYGVLVGALEQDYVNEAPLHETVFIHVVHGFSPLE